MTWCSALLLVTAFVFFAGPILGWVFVARAMRSSPFGRLGQVILAFGLLLAVYVVELRVWMILSEAVCS